MNKEEKKQVNEEDKDPEDEEIDLYPPRKVRKKEDKKKESKRLQRNHSPSNSSAKSIESFSDLLLPNFRYQTVSRMRYVHNAAIRRHTWSSSLSFGSFSDLDVAPHPLFWKIVDVPAMEIAGFMQLYFQCISAIFAMVHLQRCTLKCVEIKYPHSLLAYQSPMCRQENLSCVTWIYIHLDEVLLLNGYQEY